MKTSAFLGTGSRPIGIDFGVVLPMSKNGFGLCPGRDDAGPDELPLFLLWPLDKLC
jgi:hypothetical protein